MSTFAVFCRNNLDLQKDDYYEEYKSLSVCIIDCVYSLRARYFAVTVPVVNRFASRYMNGDKYSDSCSLEEFLRISEKEGIDAFAYKMLKNKQKLSGRLKSEICFDLAKALLSIGIKSMKDFSDYKDIRFLERTIKSVRGIGDAGMNYMFMLAGDSDRCKPDVHIHHAIRDAFGYDVSDEECQRIFSNTVAELKKDYPEMTVRRLDGLVWDKYQKNKRKREKK